MRPPTLALASIALACPGCPSRSAAPPQVARLVDVKVLDRTVGEEREAVDVAAIQRRAADDLGAAHALPVALGAAPVAGVDYRLAIEVRLETLGGASPGPLRAFVDARLRRVDAAVGDSPIERRAVAEGPTPMAEPPPPHDAVVAADRRHLDRAVDDVMKGLVASIRIRRGGSDELLSALAAPDAEVRSEAIRVAGERRERAAVPALILQLKGEDTALRDQAIGALVAIGDRRAVKPLTEVAHFRDVTELPKVIDALASLGGDEARAWLEFVASGHDEKDVRELAREGLDRMDRRAAVAAPAAEPVR